MLTDGVESVGVLTNVDTVPTGWSIVPGDVGDVIEGVPVDGSEVAVVDVDVVDENNVGSKKKTNAASSTIITIAINTPFFMTLFLVTFKGI
jgi:hypothetical protein